jgi:hypothetical protein
MSQTTYTPGFGDIATWPGLAGHQHDPRTPDADDILSPDQALEHARDMVASTPAVVAEWLQQECCDSLQDLSSYELAQALRCGDALSVPQLLCLLMDGYCDDLRAVRMALREAFDEYADDNARSMSRAILGQQDRTQ